MPERPPLAIFHDSLWAHPAVRCWSAMHPGRGTPTTIQVLREGQKRCIYRLTGAGPRGSDVIAKRCRVAAAAIERTIYEEVLPHVPVTAPRYYGCQESGDGYCWLFLEDVGSERWAELNQEHAVLAARWLALMHTAAGTLTAAARLPDGGPRRYLGHLREGRSTIQRHLSNRALTDEDRDVLKQLVAQCDFFELRWREVEQRCASAPATLVHGDFRPKNAHIRNTPGGIAFFPIDWETAGWGPPAADLPCVDLATYSAVVREFWPGLDIEATGRLATIGQLFRWLGALTWESTHLGFRNQELLYWPMSNMRIYHAEFCAIMQEAPFASQVTDAGEHQESWRVD
jgi:hypothetical protein